MTRKGFVSVEFVFVGTIVLTICVAIATSIATASFDTLDEAKEATNRIVAER